MGLLWAGIIAASLLYLGLPVWWGLVGRRPRPAELCGPVFVLGCAVLAVVSALLISLRQTTFAPMAGALAGAVLISLALNRARLNEKRAVVGEAVSAFRKSVGSAPLWWGAFGTLAAVEFLVALAPNTAWDAYNLHYGIVEKFWRGGTLAPMGMAASEYQHLNTQVLYTLWMTVGGEPASNLFSLVQVLSLSATVYLGVLRYADAFWARLAALIVAALPVTVHQSTGGWVDTLLIQCLLLAYLCYETSHEEARPVAWAVLAGAFGGFAWGVKQSAPALLLPLGLLAFYDLVRAPARRVPVLALGAALVAVAAPWVLRTWAVTGNPLYPAFSSLTRLPESFDVSEAVGHRSPLPFGFFEMFLVHSGVTGGLKGAALKWLDDGIPAWLLALLVGGGGVALWKRGLLGGLGRYWVAAVIGFGPTYLFFFGNPRYGLFPYVLALVCVAATLGSALGEVKLLRWTCGGLAALSFLLGLAIAGGKLWNRRDVLLGRTSAEAYVGSVYPHLQLLQQARTEVQAGEGVVVFNGLSYRNGMPTFDADPRLTGRRVVNWSSHSREEVLANLRELNARWIVVPFGYGRFAAGTALWASQQAERGVTDPTKLRTALAEGFPEWQWKEGTPLWIDPSAERFALVVARLSELRPWLEPKRALPGWILYRLRDEPVSTVRPAGKPPRTAEFAR